MNPLLATDFYKISHREQYPEGTNLVYSNFTARSGKLSVIPDHLSDGKVVFFGLQNFVDEYLYEMWNEEFFDRDLDKVLKEYESTVFPAIGPHNTDHIKGLHQLGYLPLEIRALREGVSVPFQVPLLTIQNTHKDFAWLTNYIETALSVYLWKPTTAATIAKAFRKLLEYYAELTGTPKEFVDFQGHDFSFRGMSGIEDAARVGAGHLLYFLGTDTIPAINLIKKRYLGSGLIGASVPASEHSVMCMGTKEGEIETFRRFITKLYPKNIVSIVSDTWDFWKVVTEYVRELGPEILSREGKVVLRPDCYDDQTMIMTNQGWKYFSDLTYNDYVAQVDGDGIVDYVRPTKIIAQEYDGDMVYFHDDNGKVDLLVTPNHRMIWAVDNGERIEEASDAKVGHHGRKLYRSAPNVCKNESLTALERFKIAFQADGSYQSGHQNAVNPGSVTGEICYRFTFTKQRKIDRLEQICQEGGFRHSIHTENSRENQKVIYVWIDKNELIQKDFSWVRSQAGLCSNWCREFIDELSQWDATIRSDDRYKFDTTTESVIYSVERIAIAAGYGCLITESEDNRKEHFSNVFTAHIMKDNFVGGQAIVKETHYSYSGYVYCVKVPSGKILVKRNRATAVSGNSGDPVKIICGDPDAEPNSPAYKGAVECLWEVFGGTTTKQGYRTLDDHIGLIYGDSITFDRAERIMEGLRAKGFSSGNIVFGIGSFTYQYLTRDTFGFAVKSTYGEVNGEGRAIFKDPVTDSGLKKSARGILAVLPDMQKGYVLRDNIESFDAAGRLDDCLKIAFRNGEIYTYDTFTKIRRRARK